MDAPLSAPPPLPKSAHRKANPLVFSSAGFLSNERTFASHEDPSLPSKKRSPALAPVPSPKTRRRRPNENSRYSSDQATFAPGSCVDSGTTLSSGNVDDWPADYETSSANPFSPSPSFSPTLTATTSRHDIVPMIPTDEQWDRLTDSVVAEVRNYLAAGLPIPDEEEPETSGHPVAWLLQRARTFEEWNKPHRMPTHPTPEDLSQLSQSQVRKKMSVYANRVTRASVPAAKQLSAAWRNFTIRTTNKLTQMIERNEVQSFFSPTPLIAFIGGSEETNITAQIVNLGILLFLATFRMLKTFKFTNGLPAPFTLIRKGSISKMLRRVIFDFLRVINL